MTGPADKHAHTAGCRQAIRQRDALLLQMESLVRLGRLGWSRGDAYAEVHIDSIRKAARLCKQVRAAIAKANGEKA